MQTLETLKRRISSAEDLSSVVRTMKTLAAVSIRQYELAVDSLSGYFETIEDGLKILLWNSPALTELAGPERHSAVGVIVFGSDQGMCGQFNEQVAAFVGDSIDSGEFGTNAAVSVIAVGGRAAARLLDHQHAPDAELTMPGSVTAISSFVHDLLETIDAWKGRRRLGRIVLCYNRRQGAASCRPGLQQLLPVQSEAFQKLRRRAWQGSRLPMITMPRGELVTALVRQYLFVCLFRAVAESLAAENASRIASMQSAERSIHDRLDELRGSFNQQRQNSITGELLDVLTGFEATLSGN